MKILCTSIASALMTLPFTVSGANLYLAIDVSGSNPLLSHENWLIADSCG